MTEVMVQTVPETALATLILKGDLAKLTDIERVQYYKAMCERTGLDWTTKPFDYLILNGKQVLYLNKGGAEQLNRVHNVSMSITGTEQIQDVYIVTARATSAASDLTPSRHSDSTGVVSFKGLSGDALANAFMKAETKAKRRATMSLLGLAMLDETEVESIPGAVKVEAPRVEISEFCSPNDLVELAKFANDYSYDGPALRKLILNRFADQGITEENIYTRLTFSMLTEIKGIICEAALISSPNKLDKSVSSVGAGTPS